MFLKFNKFSRPEDKKDEACIINVEEISSVDPANPTGCLLTTKNGKTFHIKADTNEVFRKLISRKLGTAILLLNSIGIHVVSLS